jgi:hypothetical protein
MKLLKNATPWFLIVLTAVFLFGTMANTYFLFRPSRYTPPCFNPHSVWDWCFFMFNALFIFYFYVILNNMPNIYARIYWLALLAIYISGFVEKYFIRFSSSASQLFSAVGCAVICGISIMFLYLHRKYRFNLFSGLTYRLKKYRC